MESSLLKRQKFVEAVTLFSGNASVASRFVFIASQTLIGIFSFMLDVKSMTMLIMNWISPNIFGKRWKAS